MEWHQDVHWRLLLLVSLFFLCSMLSRDYLVLFPQKDRFQVGILCSINAILLAVQRKADLFCPDCLSIDGCE